MLPGFPSTMAAAGLVGDLITLTPASASGDTGYQAGSLGSISGEPVAGQTLNAMLDTGFIPFRYIQFDGDVTAALADFGGVQINGVRIALGSWSYNGAGFTGKTRAVPTSAWGFSAGVPATVQLVA